MSYNNGARTITNGLVMAFDAANIKCFKGEPTTNLGGAVHLGFTGERWAKTTDYPNKGALPFNLGTDVYRLANGNNYWGYASDFSFQYNKTYTLSFWYWVNTTENIIWNNSVFGTPSAGGSAYNTVSTKSADTFVTTNNTNGWRFGYVTFSTNIAVSSYSYFRGTFTGAGTDSTPTGNVYIANFQLEEKSYVTGYTSGTRGTTVATGGGMYDLSQTGNNGAVNNSPREGSDYIKSLILDGTNQYVSITPVSNTIRTYDATVVFAVKLPLYSGGQRCILSYRGGSGGNLYIGKQSSGIFCYYDTLNTPNYTVGSITDGAPVVVAIKLDATGTALSTYINGSLAGSTTRTGWVAAYNTVLNLGYDAGGTNEYMTGSLYYYAHYNRLLSDTEIKQVYYSLKSRFGLS